MLFSPTASDTGRNAALCMLGGALLCYAFAALGWMGLPVQAAFVAMLAGAVWSLAALRDARAVWFVGIVIVLLLIALGSPSDEWDPRSIWLFHAKRIYLDGTLYAQLDGYAGFSHNDYPALVPLLMAASAKLLGHWNEIFPKAAATLLFLPALLLIARSLRAWWVAGLFAFVVLKVGGTYLVDGYIDALVGVYGVASLATAMQCIRAKGEPASWLDLLAYAAVTAVLTLTKNEGTVLAGLIAAAVVAIMLLRERRLPWSLLASFVVAFLPLLAWKLAVANAQLSNDLASTDLKAQLLARLPELSNSVLILKQLFRSWALVPLLVLAVLWRRTVQTPVVLAGALAALAYAGVLYAVYLGTPHDLEWHLATSVRRTVLPVYLLLAYALLVRLDRRPAA
jgi:hypothetical protein